MIGLGRPLTASGDCQLIVLRTRSATELPLVLRPRLHVSRGGVVVDQCQLGWSDSAPAVSGTARGEVVVRSSGGGDATAAVVVGGSGDAVPGALPTEHGGDSGLPQICCSSADKSRMRSSHERPRSLLLLLRLDRPYDVDKKSRGVGIN